MTLVLLLLVSSISCARMSIALEDDGIPPRIPAAIQEVKKQFQPNDLNALVNNMNNPNLQIDSKDIQAPNWNVLSLKGFYVSLVMIIVSEIGDKTFFIAAILAMKHSRLMVWLGAAGALGVMTLLAVLFGSFMIKFVPPGVTHYGAGGLFMVFAVKLLWEGFHMKGGEASEELREVEEELREQEKDNKQNKRRSDDVELGGALLRGSDKDGNDKVKRRDTTWNVSILVKSFVMTFISEIGDRSQITTIVLAAHKSPYGVMLGAFLGHAMCTAVAVLGGKLLASRISEKNVTLIGGVLFFFFGIESLVWGPV